MNYTVQGSRLLVTDEHGATHVVDFRWPIKDVIPFGPTLVVRTDPEIGACDNENVFGVNIRGGIVWKIAEMPYVDADSPYISLDRYEKELFRTVLGDYDGEAVVAKNWGGWLLLLDPHTGSLIRKEYTK